MKKALDREIIFSKEELEDALRIWEKCSISLMDIRHSLISSGEAINSYIMPANTFIYTNGGKAEVSIGDNSYNVDNFGIFHGGKGAELSIKPIESWIETYMILYKASEPSFYRRDFHRLIENMNPFSLQYGFQPSSPLFFGSKFLEMYEKWQKPSPLNLFYEKAAFYQIVYSVYEELVNENVSVFSLDIISMAKRYIDGHYSEAISIQNIAYMLGVSDSNLRRNFKKRYGKSPQEYLIKSRLEQAKKMLNTRKISVKSVAVSCGFQDEFNFSKLFLKNVGMSPTEYRAKTPINISDYTMDSDFLFPYNKESLVRVGKLFEEGEYKMFKQLKNKTVIAAALSLTLLLTACSSAASSNGAKSNNEESQSVDEGTRVINTMMGDVEIPVKPKRIVVAQFQGDILSLGIEPVGTSFNDGAVFEGDLSSTTVIDSWEPNYEEIAALEPDIIIWIQKDNYDQLSKIAPTVIMPYYEWGYEERVKFFGDLVNKKEEAEKVVTEFNKKILDAKESLSNAGISDKTVSLFEMRDNGVMRVFGADYGRGGEIIYKHLGLNSPKRIKDEVFDKDGVSYIDISYETLQDYAGDYIFSDEQIEKMKGNNIWESVPTVKNGNVVQVESGMFWFSDIQSFNAQLDVIVNGLLEKAKS
ncbi:AraC family transcriptional regulator [Clostridium intestinale]|uniref:AraC family transcriptional regulator n=1 Tax=Clostridium intestinale TaxID=36845 RepID=UPI002DD698A2|nr:AraC family transcriptional regulator [Clostridium intestinale]WRY51363.1 AraC family transcriptional regulator [Clostridium intestinale]